MIAPAYLPPPDASGYLGISPRFLADLTRRRVIPSVKLGRRCVRYRLADLDAAMDRFRRQAIGEGRG
jgi:excisionase family DNA binding protein